MTDTTIIIQRTGQPPLRFAGELIAAASSQQEHGNRRHRWHEVRLYVIWDTSRSFWTSQRVAEVEYISRWSSTNKDPELGRRWAVVCDQAELPARLAEYQPVEDVTGGYPPIPRFEQQQARLLMAVATGFREAVGAALAQAGYVEDVN